MAIGASCSLSAAASALPSLSVSFTASPPPASRPTPVAPPRVDASRKRFFKVSFSSDIMSACDLEDSDSSRSLRTVFFKSRFCFNVSTPSAKCSSSFTWRSRSAIFPAWTPSRPARLPEAACSSSSCPCSASCLPFHVSTCACSCPIRSGSSTLAAPPDGEGVGGGVAPSASCSACACCFHSSRARHASVSAAAAASAAGASFESSSWRCACMSVTVWCHSSRSSRMSSRSSRACASCDLRSSASATAVCFSCSDALSCSRRLAIC